jgi:predicted helicase
MALIVKSNHKVIVDYYREMRTARETNQLHEGAVAPHFAQVLRHCLNQSPHLTLVEQYFIKRDGRKPLRADGALVDKQTNVLLYGIWEAKDSKDQLDKEVKSKFKEGYPADNILFQSPDQIILYQHGVLIFDAVITDNPEKLITGLELFLSYKPPVYAQWEEAIVAFKEKVGELGVALVQIILNELKVSGLFKTAFDHFSALCQTTINPNLAQSAVIEMLVQHLLTERLFRTIFNNANFINNNVIAKEIENVIRALTSRSFSRHEFLKSLDRFYLAIEETASTIHSYSRKQDFLNAIYERFFQGFAVKVADTHGIVYTPQPIVDFMVNSVQEILKREFNKDLANAGVQVLDPFTGTGNFILRIMQEIAANKNELDIREKFKHKYHNELHCNEIMLLPYYIASMNIERAYYDYVGEYAPFKGICLVDTFELSEPKQSGFSFVPENIERVNAQKAAPIFVIIGNPPYNAWQQNENDNNKNRKYPYIDGLIASTYAKYSKATLKNSLSDAYVKAFAWATERLQGQDKGIIAFVSNNGFLDGIAADGMRKHLSEEFSKIYHLNLKGNARTSGERRRQEGGNIFNDQIRVSIGITFLIKNLKHTKKTAAIYVYSIDDYLKVSEKSRFLEESKNILAIKFKLSHIDERNNWLTNGLVGNFDTFTPIGSKDGKATKNQAQGVIFKLYGRGVTTSRDAWAYHFNSDNLANNMRTCIDSYNEHVFRYSRLNPKPDIDSFAIYDDKKLSWDGTLKGDLEKGNFANFSVDKIRSSLYRPFTRNFLFFDRMLNNSIYRFPIIFPTPETEQENRVICLSGIGSNKPFHSLIVRMIPCLDILEKTQCFPFYIYDKEGQHRQENLTDWALKKYQSHYQDDRIDKWAIFYYVYGLLHHTGYKEKYAANLKRELPHIPYTNDFWKVSDAGKRLAELHLNYEMQAEYPLRVVSNGLINWRVEKMRLNKDKTALTYNETLTLSDIPPEVFNYRLGNRSALDWVIDQYQVSVDKRSGIVNDPNRRDDERYIVRLIQQIVTVSLETVRLVEEISQQPLMT